MSKSQQRLLPNGIYRTEFPCVCGRKLVETVNEGHSFFCSECKRVRDTKKIKHTGVAQGAPRYKTKIDMLDEKLGEFDIPLMIACEESFKKDGTKGLSPRELVSLVSFLILRTEWHVARAEEIRKLASF